MYNRKMLAVFIYYWIKDDEFYFCVILHRKIERDFKKDIYYILKYMKSININILYLTSDKLLLLTVRLQCIHIARAMPRTWIRKEIVTGDIAIFPRREESHNYGRLLEISRLPRSHIRGFRNRTARSSALSLAHRKSKMDEWHRVKIGGNEIAIVRSKLNHSLNCYIKLRFLHLIQSLRFEKIFYFPKNWIFLELCVCEKILCIKY